MQNTLPKRISAALILAAVGFTLSVEGVRAQTPPIATTASPACQVALSHVPSDRKWRSGLFNRTYEKASTELETLIDKKLPEKGMTQTDSLSGPCCKLVVEVVEISQHVAAFGKGGMDIVATFTVQDAGGKQIFSKVYRGESRSIGGHTWGGLLDMAEKLLVDNAFESPDLAGALTGAGAGSASR